MFEKRQFLKSYMIVSFTQKLFELGFFTSVPRDEIFKFTRLLSPQYVGHHIGLDLHDCLDIPTSQKVRAGMVVNILPGIYVPEDDRFPEKYHGIGVRIEDTIALNKNGAEVLTAMAPTDLEQIEAILSLPST